MPWQVRKRDVDFFVHDLWKDSRLFTTLGSDQFGKDCYSEVAAHFESKVLTALASEHAPGTVPTIHRVEGSILIMERISGMRLFDLIRCLKSLEAIRKDSKAATALAILIDRAGRRLAMIQVSLLGLAKSGDLGELKPYPLEIKVSELVKLLIRVLGLRDVPSAWNEELAMLMRDWESSNCSVPFRDATTKNMIVRVENYARFASVDLESEQREMINSLLDTQGMKYWQEVVLTDVDFSSTLNLTSPEDDPISLFFHEWTVGTVPLAVESIVLDSELGVPEPRRAAVTLMVRYLRFGGRKLAYKLINSQGYSVRFAYDNPLYYFENLRANCDVLDPTLSKQCPVLFDVFAKIAHAVRNASVSDLQVTQIDHVRRYYPHFTAAYWQQSPFEGG